jgi:hypothetical protein
MRFGCTHCCTDRAVHYCLYHVDGGARDDDDRATAAAGAVDR